MMGPTYRAPVKGAMIAVVDDDESVRDSTRTLLRSVGYRVATFDSAERFLSAEGGDRSECIVLDVRMPGMDGLELQRRLKSSEHSIPIIFITGHGDGRMRRTAMDRGAVDFLLKPFNPSALVAAVRTALAGRPEPPPAMA
jgi:two-component system response regulator FixJ